MRYYSVFAIFLLLTLISCGREDFVGDWNEEVVIPPSEEVFVDEINGLVRDVQGELVSNALIELISDRKVIAETHSDSQGKFQFLDVILEQNYYLRISKSNFLTEFQHLIVMNDELEDLEIRLIDNQGGSLNDNPLSYEDDQVVFVSGLLIDDNQIKYNGLLTYSWTSTSDYYTTYVSEGRFVMIIPSGESVTVSSVNSCSGSIAPIDFPTGPYFDSEELGNVEIEESGSIVLSGFIEECESDSIPLGSIITLMSLSATLDTLQTVSIVDGSFEFTVNECQLNQPFFLVGISDLVLPVFIEILPGSGPVPIDLVLCDEFVNESLGEIILQHETEGDFEFDELVLFGSPFDPNSYCIMASGEDDEIYLSGTLLIDVIYEEVFIHFDFIQLHDGVYFGQGLEDLFVNELVLPSAAGEGFLDVDFNSEVFDFFSDTYSINGNINLTLPAF